MLKVDLLKILIVFINCLWHIIKKKNVYLICLVFSTNKAIKV